MAKQRRKKANAGNPAGVKLLGPLSPKVRRLAHVAWSPDDRAIAAASLAPSRLIWGMSD